MIVSTSEGTFAAFLLSKYDLFGHERKSFYLVSCICICEFSFAGMALMFGGLYFVLWAKGKEESGEGDESKEDEEESVLRTEFDLEKPLLR